MTGFWMAWGMFCSIPCPVMKWDNKKYPQMLIFLPSIGLMIGLIWCLCALGISKIPKFGLLGAVILAFVPAALSGFTHLDGFMDCSDAVLSRRDLETRRKILKDSRVGAFAVIMILLWALLMVSSLASMDISKTWLNLLFIPATVRSCSATACLSFKPMNTSGYSSLPETVKPYHKFITLAEMITLITAAALICGISGLCTAAGAAAAWVNILLVRRNLEGMSGDIAGCCVVTGELVSLIALVFLS